MARAEAKRQRKADKLRDLIRPIINIDAIADGEGPITTPRSTLTAAAERQLRAASEIAAERPSYDHRTHQVIR
jgi:hypothetical protein